MSWPASPLTTFTGTGPAVDSTFLNNLQTGVNQLCLGTTSHAAIVVDGNGGVASSPAGAQIVVGQSTLSDVPLTVWNDKGSNVRGVVDHNGYRRGRVNEFYEDWLTIGPSTISGANTVTTGRLNWNFPASASLLLDSSTLGGSTGMRFTGTNVANANVLRINSSSGVVGNANFVSSIQEFDIAAVALTSVDLIVGLTGTPSGNGGTPTNVTYIALCKRSTDTNWQLLTGTGGTPTLTDCGVAPTSLDKIIIEGHGSLSPLGAATARIFINGTLRATTTTTVPMTTASGMLSMMVAMTTKSGTNSIDLAVSPFRGTSNRFLSAT